MGAPDRSGERHLDDRHVSAARRHAAAGGAALSAPAHPGAAFARWIHLPDPAAEPPPASLVGGKAHNLARLAATGVRVPVWFAINVHAFQDSASPDEEAPVPEAAEAWRQALLHRGLPEPLRAAIAEALRLTGLAESLLAVRSSAVGEDGGIASFAGQFDSVLGVTAAGVEDAVLRVWASAAGERALGYAAAPPAMAVIVQEMVDAEVAGVAFGADPLDGARDRAVVSAVFGLGEGLVSGLVDADTFHVEYPSDGSRPTIRSTLAAQQEALRLGREGGTERVSLEGAGGTGAARTLSDAEALEIAAATRRLGDHFGSPQDVEWALARDGRALHILQARPITTLGRPATSGERRVWDNSNIVESYSGITSPLTFSFALQVYEAVYRQFCEVVGVPPALVERHRHVFANMLGLVRGRVYYNLLNWYRTLALLPGYSVNRAFMERMMGVREKLDDPPRLEATSGRVADAVRMARMATRLVRHSWMLTRAVPAFHARVDRALKPLAREDLTTWDADRLVGLYRHLEEELLDNWQTPLVNDFFAMIWFGLLGSLIEKWLPDAPPTLVNDLLTHEGGIISTEPARRVAALAEQVRSNPALRDHFELEPDDTRLRERLAGDPAAAPFLAAIDAYLEMFGDRCMNELKLETITLGEDPSFLYRTIRDYLRGEVPLEPESRAVAMRAEAEALVAARLRPLRLRLFDVVLRQARSRVRDRENLRFERTRVFGIVRRIFLALGAELHRGGRLSDARDVFFLRIEEVFAHVEGTATQESLADLVDLRRREWEGYGAAAAPPDRFESYGPVAAGNWRVPATTGAVPGDDTALQGIGCCPGVVRAPVRLVRDPRDAGDLGGRILVAERTDPGWTLLFPIASGLLVQRGSLLSHSAIVAREVGLPCVVSIPGLMDTLRDGEMVEMDGTTGLVRRLDG